MTSSDETATPPIELDWYLSRLEESTKSLKDAPNWKSVTIVEGFIAGDVVEKWPRHNLYTPESFSERFKEIITRGHSWVNLSAVGVLEGNLLISLEAVSSSIHEGCHTSVNMSGPMNKVRCCEGWNLDGFIEIVDET